MLDFPKKWEKRNLLLQKGPSSVAAGTPPAVWWREVTDPPLAVKRDAGDLALLRQMTREQLRQEGVLALTDLLVDSLHWSD